MTIILGSHVFRLSGSELALAGVIDALIYALLVTLFVRHRRRKNRDAAS